jgi:hypothetical protein
MKKLSKTVLGLLLSLALLMGAAACDSGGGESEGGEDVVAETDDGGGEPACVPDCDGKSCGGDGCGGECGHCYTMEGNLNDDLCLPDQNCTACGCGDRVCGTDLCGSPCGSCLTNHLCTDVGACELDLAACDAIGISDGQQTAKMKSSEDGFMVAYSMVNEHGDVMRKLTLEIDNRLGLGGPTGPGEYPVQFKNLNDGGLWLYATVTENGIETTLTPSQGTINIISLDSSGGTFEATLDKVVLQEAIIEDGTPIKMPNGLNWCLDGAKLMTEMAVTPEKCGDLPIGTLLNKAIGNFQLQNCNGDWMDLYDACQKNEALWVVATAGW